MSPRVKSKGFKLPVPDFSSPVTDYVMDLEYLRRHRPMTSTDPILYRQLSGVFKDLDAVASARIDGNKTGLSKFLEAKEEDPEIKGRKTIEIDKIAQALQFIDDNLNTIVFYSGFLTELHKLIREDLTKESSRNAGKFRRGTDDEIQRPDLAPESHQIDIYNDSLITLINKEYSSKFDAIKTMLVHQKFLWIHPFREANGHISRLLSYTMLKRYGFDGSHGRIINSAMGICPDIQQYLFYLKKADSNNDKAIMDWLAFSLKGLRDNLVRMDQLYDYTYLKDEIINPALKHPLFDRLFTDQDRLIMGIAVDKQVFQAADIRTFFPQKHPTEISKMLRWLKDKELIINLEDNSRKYAVNLRNKYLVKLIVARLDKNGFLPFEK